MAPTRRVKIPTVPIFSSKAEADLALARIGELQRQRIGIMTEAEARISELNEEARQATAPIDTEIDDLVKNLAHYAEYNRADLTENGKTKTVTFTHGTLQWRLTPVAITVKSVDEVLARLRALDLTRFIRTKYEVNKEAMGAEPEVAVSVEGVSFSRHEDFVVTPSETKVEIDKRIRVKTPRQGSAHI